MQDKLFPNHQQQLTNYDCGPHCLNNVYEFFGEKTSPQSISENLHRTNKEFSFPSELAQHALIKKYDVILFSSSPHSICRSWNKLDGEKIIPKLKNWLKFNQGHNWRTNNLHLLYYLQKGGKIKIKDISTKLIDKYLQYGYKIIVCANETWIWEKRKLPTDKECPQPIYDDEKGSTGQGHFVVIYEKKDDNYLISDPYPTNIKNKNGLYSVNQDQLLISIISWNPELVAIRKKKKRKK